MNIFFGDDNYLFFLRKMRVHILNHSKILAYCLMPNHFHFLLYTSSNSEPGGLNSGIAVLLRSYTRAINNQHTMSGSIFQQKKKAKCLNKTKLSTGFEDVKATYNYARICFNYIHQNPVRAGIAKRMEDWRYSSFLDYSGYRKGTLCDIEFTRKLLGIPEGEPFYSFSNEEIIKVDLEEILE
ncbi:MAG: transposase [Ignavibacteria bacterium]